jgi:ubiquinone/menaquinone biosynthesis C-methylase UbiE
MSTDSASNPGTASLPAPLTLKRTGDERRSWEIPSAAADLVSGFNGEVSAADGDTLGISENIIRYITSRPAGITLAQQSNFLPTTARLYEETWRKRSIGFLSGEDFSLDDERQLLQSWAAPQPGELVLDLGCSTAYYARSAALKEPAATVVAIDISEPMLEAAAEKCRADEVNLYLLRADVSELPFYGDSTDLILCGGSLNEFSNPEKVLYEARRVLKKDGRMFNMHLLRAGTIAGKLAQKASEAGGISFWTEDESEQLFRKAGFRITRRLVLGVVMFSLLEPA